MMGRQRESGPTRVATSTVLPVRGMSGRVLTNDVRAVPAFASDAVIAVYEETVTTHQNDPVLLGDFRSVRSAGRTRTCNQWINSPRANTGVPKPKTPGQKPPRPNSYPLFAEGNRRQHISRDKAN
jgi:hypothetical protein